MKNLGIAVFGALSLTLLTAASALALDGGSAIPPGGNDNVLPNVIVNAPGGVAFTGSQVAVWMVVAVALFAIGVGFLIAARRRAKAASNS
jgi:hypothetical protein